MRRRAVFTAPAEEDLREIARWLMVDAGEKIAGRIIRQIRDTASRLALMPLIGRRREEFGEDVRSWPLSSYVLFYEPTKTGIRVLRVIHAKRDPKRAWRERGDDGDVTH